MQFDPSGLGWIVGKFGLILHSSDGGKSWGEQRSETSKPLTAVSFANDRDGFIVGAGGTILATTDGGKTWVHKILNCRDDDNRHRTNHDAFDTEL